MFSQLSRRILGVAALLALGTTAQALHLPLSGSYTVCPDGSCNFLTVQAAADTLRNKGVSGPVVINISGDVYTETVLFRAIPNTSSTNTVTIRGNGSSGPNRTVINGSTGSFTGNTTSNQAVFTMFGVNWVTIENLRVVNSNSSGNRSAIAMFKCNNSSLGFGVIAEGSRAIAASSFNSAVFARRNTDCSLNSMNTIFGVRMGARIGSNTNFLIRNCSINGQNWAGGTTTYDGLYSNANNGLNLIQSTFKGGQGTGGSAITSIQDDNFYMNRSQVYQSNGTLGLYMRADSLNGAMYNITNNYFVFVSDLTALGAAVSFRDGNPAGSAGNSQGSEFIFEHNTIWSDAFNGNSPGNGLYMTATGSITNRQNFYTVTGNLFHSEGSQTTYSGGNYLAFVTPYSTFESFGENNYSNAGGVDLRVGATSVTFNGGSSETTHQNKLDSDFGTMDYSESISFVTSQPFSRRLSAQGPRSNKETDLTQDNEGDARCQTNPTIGADEFTATSDCNTTPVAAVAVSEADFTVTLLGNPTAEAFRFISSEDAVATLWTLTGAQVGSINAQAGYVNTLGSSLPAGQYILRVATASGVKNLSVVKL